MKVSQLAILAKALCAARGHPATAIQHAEHMRASPEALSVIKAAMPSAMLSDSDWLGSAAGRALSQTFIESLRSVSIFERLRQDAMVPAPLRTQLVAISQVFAAGTRGEGQAIPLTRMALSGAAIGLRSASAITILSDALVQQMTPQALAFVERELKRAVGAALDASFIDLVTTGAPSIASTGTDFEAMRLDIRSLLEIVNTEGNGRLFWLMTPGIANSAATMTDAVGGQVAPGMTPVGGEFLGQPALVSDQVPGNQLILVDASRIAADLEGVALDVAKDAAVEMRDDPTGFAGSTPVPAQMVSLFQSNLVGLKSRAYFGVERTRANAVAVLTNCVWGGAVPAS